MTGKPVKYRKSRPFNAKICTFEQLNERWNAVFNPLMELGFVLASVIYV
jgi:hypothetical protein